MRPLAIEGPDSLEANTLLSIQFYYEASFYGQLPEHTIAALDDSTFELHVTQEINRPNLSCQGGEHPSTFRGIDKAILAHPPARRFSIRSGPLVLWIQGGAASTAANRLTIRVLNRTGAALQSLEVNLSDGSGLVRLDSTDALGMSIAYGTCRDSGSSYFIEASSNEEFVTAEAHWPIDCLVGHSLIMTTR